MDNKPDYVEVVLEGGNTQAAVVSSPVPAEDHKALSNELALIFRGSAQEYFRIWIVNLCLTILTCGFFSAWAKVRKKRYFYSNTILDDTPFQYLGQPIPILKGRIIAAALFLAYYLSSHFFASLLPYVVAAGIVIAPWIIIRSAAFNARYSAFRNMTFQFKGRYLDACKVFYAWGLVPAFIVSVMVIGKLQPDSVKSGWVMFPIAAIFLVFGFAFPWWMRSLKNFIITNSSYGGKNGSFSATGGQFFGIYFRAGLIMVGILFVLGFFTVLLFADMLKKSPTIFGLLILGATYLGYALAYAYVQAHSTNLVWNHTRLGPLRFQSTLRGRGMAKLYLTNALGIIASLGLLIPWAVMRTIKYRVDNMRVLREGDLSDFQGSESSSVHAIGSETVDFFDVDFSL